MPLSGFGPFRPFLRSVTAKVLHDVECPVWTSAHLEYWPVIENISLQNILCGMDFGPRSSGALKCASQLAAEFGATLTVAHAIPLADTRASSAHWREEATRAAEENANRIEACLASTILTGRVDSSCLLPNAARCLMKNVTRPFEREEWQVSRRQLSVETRRELIEAVAARYRAADRDEKKGILTN